MGNVLVTISDKKLGLDQNFDNRAESYQAQVKSAQDYYPFGWTMPGRQLVSTNYRYGFNGKENDKEWGDQLIQDYGFRLYNPAVGKFLSVDPLSPDYPMLTPYQFASNNPIRNIDLDGLEGIDAFLHSLMKGDGNIFGYGIAEVGKAYDTHKNFVDGVVLIVTGAFKVKAGAGSSATGVLAVPGYALAFSGATDIGLGQAKIANYFIGNNNKKHIINSSNSGAEMIGRAIGEYAGSGDAGATVGYWTGELLFLKVGVFNASDNFKKSRAAYKELMGPKTGDKLTNLLRYLTPIGERRGAAAAIKMGWYGSKVAGYGVATSAMSGAFLYDMMMIDFESAQIRNYDILSYDFWSKVKSETAEAWEIVFESKMTDANGNVIHVTQEALISKEDGSVLETYNRSEGMCESECSSENK